ncbi:unnamed protein product [Cylicocyclus nassatus]|uniref:Uncharacterized protein n=1 Tax=Cylicocyclus nassatus TaxID=53992 RepID=A0AA36GWE9_CYLNA|nr:unnamed protein product [Cylicocyclus nassatus]
MKLLSSVAVFFAVIPVSPVIVDWPAERPLICQFFLRRGHMYIHHTDDTKRSEDDYSGIAVLVDVNEIVFGRLPFHNARNKSKRETSNILFQTARGSQEADNYFLLIADRYRLERKNWKDGYNNKKNCKMVQFHFSVPMLIKKNATDPNSPKFVGTYNVIRDKLYYTDDDKERVVHVDLKKKFDSGYVSTDGFEVLCVHNR